jgi:hypothetical protein
MSKGNPSIRDTIVAPTSGIKTPSIDQRINKVENQLVPLRSIEMAGQGERVLQGKNTVIPGGSSKPAPALIPDGYSEMQVNFCVNNNTPTRLTILVKNS